MQRPTTTARSSDEHRIVVPAESCDDDDDASSGQLYKEHSQSPSILAERLIHLIPLVLILCFLLLWLFSHPADLVIKIGSTEGGQENETMANMLDHPLVDFSILKSVLTSQAPAPQNHKAVSAANST